MIPLHLKTTTVAIPTASAKQLVALGLADWIPGGFGVVAKPREDSVVLAALR